MVVYNQNNVTTESSTNAADRIIGQRLQPKTRDNYRKAVERFVAWLGRTHPNSPAYIAENQDGVPSVALEHTT